MASLFCRKHKSRTPLPYFFVFSSSSGVAFSARFCYRVEKQITLRGKYSCSGINVAGVYDLFADIFNKETHKALIAAVSSRITPYDAVLECACGTGLLTGAIAERCRTLLATDFSANMLKRAKKKYGALPNVTFRQADILHLDEPDGQFDVVIAANVIHLLDEPYKALAELDRVCRSGGTIIVPTYMNRSEQGKTSGFASTVGKAGADFKRQFTFDTYKQFIAAAGYDDVDYAYCPGRVPCAVAVIHKP